MKKTIIVIFLIISGVGIGSYFSEFTKDSINKIFGKELFDTLKEKENIISKVEKEKKTLQKKLVECESDKTNASDNLTKSKMPNFKWKIATSDPDFIKKIKIKHNGIVEGLEKRFKQKVGTLSAEIFEKNKTLANQNNELKKTKLELEKANSKLLKAKNILEEKIKAMEDLKIELERRIKEEMRLKKIADDWKNKFKNLKIKFEGNKISVKFKSDILFNLGSHKLRESGIKELKVLAPELIKNAKEFDIFVAGHTDNIPVKGGKYKSNWELSTFRAISVVNYLMSKGLPPKSISAAGYGKYRPITDNKTAKNREKNRRVEIFLLPKIIKRDNNKKVKKSNLEKETNKKQ